MIRALAVMLVISGHFFVINTDFRNTPVNSVSMFVQSVVMSISLAGVPLFIMMTGYLNCNKTLSRKYYKAAYRVLLSYLVLSIVTILFRVHWLGEEKSLWTWSQEILKFSAIQYAWYIEMWFGLFLLSPFLNIIWHNLKGKRQKQVLILTIALLAFLPWLTNRYGIVLLPDYWKNIYPLGLYFIGAYIKDYRPKVGLLKGILLILGLCSLNGIASASVGAAKVMNPMGEPWGLLGVVVSVTIFLLLYEVDVKKIATRKLFEKVALLSLDMYLCAYLMDKLVYPWFMENCYVDQHQFGVYWFVIVPILFFGAAALAYSKELVFNGVSFVGKKIGRKQTVEAGTT